MGSRITIIIDEKFSTNEMYKKPVVCFCDIPEPDLKIHISKYSRFGLSFLKSYLIPNGANPIFYIAKNSVVWDFGKKISRSDYFDTNLKEYYQNIPQLKKKMLKKKAFGSEVFDFVKSHKLIADVFSFLKVFDDSKQENDPENYYMEREWRIVGNLKFELKDVCRVIIPKSFAKNLRTDLPNYFGQISFVDNL